MRRRGAQVTDRWLGMLAVLSWSVGIGMFAVASINLGRVDSVPVAETIGHVMLVVAAAVWLVVFGGMLIALTRIMLPSQTVAVRGER